MTRIVLPPILRTQQLETQQTCLSLRKPVAQRVHAANGFKPKIVTGYGVELFNSDNETIIQTTSLEMSVPERVKGVQLLSKDSEWCTKDEEWARFYFAWQPSIEIFRHGKRIGGFCDKPGYRMLRDENNEPLFVKDLDFVTQDWFVKNVPYNRNTPIKVSWKEVSQVLDQNELKYEWEKVRYRHHGVECSGRRYAISGLQNRVETALHVLMMRDGDNITPVGWYQWQGKTVFILDVHMGSKRTPTGDQNIYA